MSTDGVRGRRLGIAFILVGGLTCLTVGTVLVLDPSAGEVGFDDLQVGDCLRELDRGGQARSVPVTSCEDSHAAQVFATFSLEEDGGSLEEDGGSLEDGAFPGEQRVGELAEAGCAERLAEREDPVDLDRYAVTTVTPTAQSWADGDRAVQCLLGARDGSALTGSVLEGDGA